MNNDKLEKSAKALLSLPSVPQNKKKGDSRRRWKMLFDENGNPKIVEIKD